MDEWLYTLAVEWTDSPCTAPGDTVHIVFMWMASPKTQFQKPIWIVSPKLLAFPPTRAQFKDKNAFTRESSPYYLCFYFSLHISRLVWSFTFHCQYLDSGVETQLNLLIHCISNYRRDGLGSIYENLYFIHINTNIYIHMSYINMYLCMYVHLSIYLQLNIFWAIWLIYKWYWHKILEPMFLVLLMICSTPSKVQMKSSCIKWTIVCLSSNRGKM